jgi:acyl-CoA thioester hydrolase
MTDSASNSAKHTSDPLRQADQPEPAKPPKGWPDLAGRIGEDGVHRLGVRVYYEDTDFSGIVYHASYLRFMERGRSDFMRMTGLDHRDLYEPRAGYEGGLAFAVRKMTIEFFSAATIDDVLEVETVMAEMRGASMTIRQRVLKDGQPVVTADVKVALVHKDGRARRMPLWLRKVFAPHAPAGADADEG